MTSEEYDSLHALEDDMSTPMLARVTANASCPVHGTDHMVNGVCHGTHVREGEIERQEKHEGP